MLSITKAVLQDINQLTLLFDQYRVFYQMKSDVLQARSFLTERIRNKESEIFLASSNNLVTGFVQLYPIFSSTRMKRLWLLNDLFVHEEYRQQGVSTALINQSKELCRETNACALLLETEKKNLAGNSLYLKTGFKLIENNFYSWNVE